MPFYLNDGSQDAPKLQLFLNQDNLADAPAGTDWPDHRSPEGQLRLKADGFVGLQYSLDTPPASSPLAACGLNRINAPEDADTIAAAHQQRGDLCISVHVGWGIESDAEIDLLLEAILNASEKYQLPIFIETHRATITQDMWRTVEMTKRFPDLLFNGDFSHYYCGQEMPYGDFARKLAFMQPIFDRVGFMHGRIASPGHIQAPVHDNLETPPDFSTCQTNYVAHFREMWFLAMNGFKQQAGRGDVLIFAPELLSPRYDYARADTQGIEESDRYQQALLYQQIAKQCFIHA